MRVKEGDYITYVAEKPNNRFEKNGYIYRVMEAPGGKQYAVVKFYKELPYTVEVSEDTIRLRGGNVSDEIRENAI